MTEDEYVFVQSMTRIDTAIDLLSGYLELDGPERHQRMGIVQDLNRLRDAMRQRRNRMWTDAPEAKP